MVFDTNNVGQNLFSTFKAEDIRERSPFSINMMNKIYLKKGKWKVKWKYLGSFLVKFLWD